MRTFFYGIGASSQVSGSRPVHQTAGRARWAVSCDCPQSRNDGYQNFLTPSRSLNGIGHGSMRRHVAFRIHRGVPSRVDYIGQPTRRDRQLAWLRASLRDRSTRFDPFVQRDNRRTRRPAQSRQRIRNLLRFDCHCDGGPATAQRVTAPDGIPEVETDFAR